jgi:hypothetical protein
MYKFKFRPNENKILLLTIDDINMPMIDKFNCQPPIEMLR